LKTLLEFNHEDSIKYKMVSDMASKLLGDKCPECGGEALIHDYDTGETICKNCGLVIEDTSMNTGPEWRAFTQEEESRSRVGMPESYSVYDKGLTTTINQIDRDASGRKLPIKTRIEMLRLRKWNIRSRVHSSIERNLSHAMTEIDRLSDKLSIPEHVKEKAAVIYRKALNKGLVRGRTIAGIAAASVYAACRLTRTPRNLRDVSEKSLVSRKELTRDYRLILRELEIHAPIINPKTYLTKIAEKAGLSEQIQSHALKVLREADEKHVLTGKDVADAAGVTEVTVRNRYRTLRRQLNLEFD